MAKIGSLTVDLTLKSATFIRDLAKSSQAVARSSTAMQRSLTSLESGFAAVFSARLVRQITNVTEESLKLAASMHGPLADAATTALSQFEELQHTFQLGLAKGFLDNTNQGLVSTKENTEKAGEAGTVFGSILGAIANDAGQFFGTDLPGFIDDVQKKWRELNGIVDEFKGKIVLPELSQEGMLGELGITPEDTKIVLSYGTAAELAALETEAFWGATVSLTAAGEELLRTLSEQDKILVALRTPAEDYAASLEKIALANLSGEDAARAHSAATAALVGNYLQLADNIGTALGTMFKESKAVAVAQAVINTAQAVMKTFAEYGATPWGYALAASMAAIGAAQIAAIVSAQPGSSRATKTAAGTGSAATAKAGTASRGRGVPGQAVTINIVGDVFGPEHFRKIVEGINGVQRDGTALIRVAA